MLLKSLKAEVILYKGSLIKTLGFMSLERIRTKRCHFSMGWKTLILMKNQLLAWLSGLRTKSRYLVFLVRENQRSLPLILPKLIGYITPQVFVTFYVLGLSSNMKSSVVTKRS